MQIQYILIVKSDIEYYFRKIYKTIKISEWSDQSTYECSTFTSPK